MDVRSPFFQNIATVLIGVMFLNPIVSTAADLAVDAAAGGNTSLGAAANGVPVVNIATRQVVPNVLPTLLIYGTSLLGLALVFAGGMSFLGLGVAPPAPEWGQMINEQQQYMYTAPWSALVPALVIFAASLIFNQLGDALRDLLDIRRSTR